MMLRGYVKAVGLFLVKLITPSRSHVSVLMYHSVSGGKIKYDVPKTEFEKQLKYLVKNYRVVPLSDVVSYAKGERALQGSEVALTFDDGYEDTYTNVFPLLKKHAVPATVFLTSDLSRKEALGNIPRISKEQIREMSDSGLVSFEVHGRMHKNLRKLSADEFIEEVGGCMDDIEAYTGIRPRYIAYASGHRDTVVEERAENLGLEAGFGITEGTVSVGGNLYAIPRIQVDRTMPFMLFKLRATSAIDAYRKFVVWMRGKK